MLGWVISATGIIQAYGNGSLLYSFYNGVTKFSPGLAGPLARTAVVTFDVDANEIAVNVLATGALEPIAPRLSYSPE
jgi:hypothetical protein